jgi:F-type H+-transporting ATPase subunit epsilon
MAELQVAILTPQRVLKESSANIVQIPGILGYFGVLDGHTTFVSELGTGHLTINEEEPFFIAGGFCEVLENKVKILADVAEPASEVDFSRAEQAKKRAEDRLSKAANNSARGTDIDFMRAQAALVRACGRIALKKN